MMYAGYEFPKCNDSRKCFGKTQTGSECKVLTRTYRDGKCPFCKPERDVTNGRRYPYSKMYK